MGLDVREASLYEKFENKIVKCNVCPRRCFIRNNERGFCKVRENRDGILYTLIFNKITAMNVDPIEKKPFFHFWPGSLAFSISSVSCSFSCPWCQNWNISQSSPEDIVTEEIEPDKIVSFAKKYNCRSIAYTYNEPIIWFEYVKETATIAKHAEIFNLLVTNGYATEETLKELSPYVDGANVDIKAFTNDFYTKYCKGRLEDVLNAVKIMVEQKWHVELTFLLIPDLNDDFTVIRKMAQWIVRELNPNIPLHISRFYPMYRMAHLRATPLSYIVRARETALKEGLNYVYAGNVPGHESENTHCPTCHTLLVKRWGFEILGYTLTEEMTCPVCGEKIPIVGKYEKERAETVKVS